MKTYLTILFGFLFLNLLCPPSTFAQFEIYGTPHIQNYDRKVYKSGNSVWALNQDAKGNMYVATRDNLLQYDGINWKKYKTSLGGGVRDMVFDEKGTLYIADNSDIGYMTPNENGSLEYHSLAHLIPKEYRTLTFITKVISFEGEIYFESENIYYKFNPTDSSFVVDKSIEDNKLNLFRTNDRLFLLKTDKGLHEKVGNEWVQKLDSSHFDGDNLKGIFPYKEGQFLIFGSETGSFLYNENDTTIEVFTTPANQWIADNYLYTATYFQDQDKNYYYVLGSFDDGILIINQEGEVVQHINKSLGLIANDITDLHFDNRNSLWASTYKGFSKISFEMPFTFFNFYHNIDSRVNQAYKDSTKNILYIASNGGCYYLENNTFKTVQNFPHTQCWEILPLNTSDFIVAGGNLGFFYVSDKKIIQNVGGDWATMAVARSSRDSSIFYNGKYQGFELLRYQDNKFVRVGEVKAMDEIITRGVIEDKNGSVWTVNPNKGFYQIKIDNFSKKAVENAEVKLQIEGIEKIQSCDIVKKDNQVIFIAADKEYIFDDKTQRFESYKNKIFIPTNSFFTDSQDNYWDLDNKIIYINGNKEKADSTTLRILDANIKHVLEDKIAGKTVFWLSTSEGIALYQPQNTFGKEAKFSSLIRQIELSNSDSVIFFGDGQINKILDVPILEYENNSVVFKYAAPYFYLENETVFRTRLVGYDNEWSDWTNQTQKEYTNLNKGDYVFEIEAKNILHQKSEVSSFSFSVRPPFYKTNFAYIVYIFLGIFLVYFIVKAYTFRLKKSKERLEEVVKERTEEVVQKNIALESQKEEILIQSESLRQINEELNITVEMVNHQKDELEEQHRNINSSITYAKRIQDAVLPFDNRIKNTLKKYGNNDFFVWYRPRDVVSGDFYFFEEVGEKIVIIAADCTGHGVPGAFMSMVGTQLLSSIVKVNEITHPAKILEHLHEGIVEALKQQDSKNADGMDAIVITLHKNRENNSFSHLEYSAAMNSIYFIQENKNDELQYLKGTKKNIGGKQKKRLHETAFSTQTISFYDQNQNFVPTTIYLCSDGFQDQFGGEKNRKLMLRGLRTILFESSKLPLNEQKDFLESRFLAWKGKEKQVDDILIFGLKIDK